MILGIGNDLIDIRRIDKLMHYFGTRFLNRIFTPEEQTYCTSQKKQVHAYAKRFAAKEAFVKALGLGMQKGISWKDIEVQNTGYGKPFICLKGAAKKHLHLLALEKGGTGEKTKIDLSLSDEGFFALAFVILSLTPEKNI